MIPTTHAIINAKKEQIRKPAIVFTEILPRVLVSEICPIASVMDVNTIGTMTSCKERINN